MKKIVENVLDIGSNIVLGIGAGLVLFFIVASTNPWVVLPFVEGDPIPRKWFVESAIAVKEWKCINSDEYQTAGTIADVILGGGTGKITREALCDYYSEYDFWGTIGFGR